MKKILTLLLVLVFVVSAMPAAAKAEYIEYDTKTLGTLSKSNPSIHHEFSIKEEECYKFTFKISGKATKVYYHIENMNGGDGIGSYFFAGDIDGDFNQLEYVGFENGETGVTQPIGDLEEGTYSVVVNYPYYTNLDKMEVGIDVYSEGFGGKQHEYPAAKKPADDSKNKEKKSEEKKNEEQKIILSYDSLSLDKGETETLKATLTKKLKKKGVTWKSSDKSVVTVSKKGKITAKSYGTATITCTSKKDKKIKATCTINVRKPKTELITTFENIVSMTFSPVNQYVNYRTSPSVKYDSSGKTVWSAGYTANGVLRKVTSYKENSYEKLSYTLCDGWGGPAVTLMTDGSADVRDNILDGSYDFKKDSAQVVVAWRMWKDGTSKKEIETALNTKISDEIYKNLIDKYETNFSTPTIIIYGKNADGELIGKYAGTLMYNWTKNSGYYNVIGTDSSNKTEYGANYCGTVTYK
ncbi:MAG: Ig-like domain-containing protein [Lachnospiraceae bacterium]|nr:Ig-like domain-containing protein [Lachnospiraceae bacterium]